MKLYLGDNAPPGVKVWFDGHGGPDAPGPDLAFLWRKKLPAGAVNFHPAPLPDYRGFAPYTFGILNGEKEWGVSAHFTDEGYDTGPIIRVRRFPMPERVSAVQLRTLSHYRLLELFTFVVGAILRGEDLPAEPQGEGTYYSREDFERERHTGPDTEYRRRAFYCPPHDGLSLT